jgi:hypothetical protein
MRKKREPRTVADHTYARTRSFRASYRLGLFVAQWTIAQAALGHEPNALACSEWWEESTATWYRRLDEFRSVFPEHESPAAIASAVIASNPERWADLTDRLSAVADAQKVIYQLPLPVRVAL